MNYDFIGIIVNVLGLGFVAWLGKFYIDGLIKGTNYETQRITRKEAYDMIEETAKKINERLDEFAHQVEKLSNEIISIKLTLTRIETCLEKNGKLPPKS